MGIASCLALSARTVLAAAGLLQCLPVPAQPCNVTYWGRLSDGTDLFRSNQRVTGSDHAYFYLSARVAVTANGAPNAYHPDDRSGLASLAQAGYPDTLWWPKVLVQDPRRPEQALVRTAGPHAGYLYSKTALSALDKPLDDGQRFVDAARFPYLSLPGAWCGSPLGAQVGDFAYVRSLARNLNVEAVVADVGPWCGAGTGDMSMQLAQRLSGAPGDPRKPPTNLGNLIYAVFPGTALAPAWPLSAEVLKAKAIEALTKAGGWPSETCLRKP